MASIPALSEFNEAKVAEYIVGEQNNERGRALVAAGEVWEVRNADGSWTGFVHAEKTANKNYEVAVSFNNNGKIATSKCSCAARAYSHSRCKHISAILLALLAMRHYPREADKPKFAHRIGLERRLKGAPAHIRAQVGADVTWEATVKGFTAALPKHLDKCKNAAACSIVPILNVCERVFTDAPKRMTFAKADAKMRNAATHIRENERKLKFTLRTCSKAHILQVRVLWLRCGNAGAIRSAQQRSVVQQLLRVFKQLLRSQERHHLLAPRFDTLQRLVVALCHRPLVHRRHGRDCGQRLARSASNTLAYQRSFLDCTSYCVWSQYRRTRAALAAAPPPETRRPMRTTWRASCRCRVEFGEFAGWPLLLKP